jgi:branched-chain amino acid transport system ATP-binding protein
LLELKNVSVHFGKAVALEDISFGVGNLDIVTLLGANGAGKTTVLRAISGLEPVQSGEIWFDGSRIDGMEPIDIVKLGIIHVQEGRRLFPYLTVLDNLTLGASLQKDKNSMGKDLENVLNRFPVLRERASQLAVNMSVGEQQILAIGRGLMARPKILMLDEPSISLSPLIVHELADIIKEINQDGVTVLLVEQNISLAFEVSLKGCLLQAGRIVFEGRTTELKKGDTITRAYFGG